MTARSESASTGEAAEGDIPLDCYIYAGWEPRLRAAPSRRDWMDATPERFAYRCLPLNIANAHGWEVLSPCGFEAVWNGGPAVEDVVIRLDPGTSPKDVPVALFGQGTFTFHVSGLFRTPPGINLWVGGSPNQAKDGVAALSGIIETDWAPFSFTMNWRFTRADHPIRFEENEPFCFLFPVERRLIERVVPRIRPIEEAPELKRKFEEWSVSRDAFQADIATHQPSVPSEKWQKFYYRGVDAAGEPGAPDHRGKLRLSEFDGSAAFHKPGRAPACPAQHQGLPSEPARNGPMPPPGKLDWLMTTRQKLQALSPPQIARRTGMTGEEFLHCHYAANWPVVLKGDIAEWPALERWTPAYLKDRIGSRTVEVQVDRTRDPDFERNMAAHKTAMPFGTFIDRIARNGASNDLYLTAYNSTANQKALAPLNTDLGFMDRLLDRHSERPHGMPWIGPAGTFTPLHHDLTNNLLLQLVGRKEVLLVAPAETPRLYNDYHVYSQIRDLTEPDIVARFPRLDGVRVHRVELQPGEALFVPVGWWHQVRSLDFSVTITHTNFLWPNSYFEDWAGSG